MTPRKAEAMGHRLLTPGWEIEVDAECMRELREAHLLNGSRNRILPGVYQAVAMGLLSDRTIHMLGGVEVGSDPRALTGPEVCVCGCRECRGGA